MLKVNSACCISAYNNLLLLFVSILSNLARCCTHVCVCSASAVGLQVPQTMGRHTDFGPCRTDDGPSHRQWAGTSHRQWATPQTVGRPTNNGPSDRQWAVPHTMGRVPQTMGRPTDHGPSHRQWAVPQTMGRETDSGPSGGPLPQTAEEAGAAMLSPCPPASPGPAFVWRTVPGLAAPLAM